MAEIHFGIHLPRYLITKIKQRSRCLYLITASRRNRLKDITFFYTSDFYKVRRPIRSNTLAHLILCRGAFFKSTVLPGLSMSASAVTGVSILREKQTY